MLDYKKVYCHCITKMLFPCIRMLVSCTCDIILISQVLQQNDLEHKCEQLNICLRGEPLTNMFMNFSHAAVNIQ